MPTGTGKSLVIGDFLRKTLSWWPDQRLLMLTHVKELISQNLEKLKSMWPNAPAGVYSAGLGRKESMHPIVMGGVQSVARLLAKNPRALGVRHLVLIDECHLLSPKQETQYQKVLKTLRDLNPYIKVIGFTATPYRMKVGSITEGEGLFTDLAYDLCSMENFNKLMDEGFLAPLIPKRPDLVISMDGVNLVAGEYNAKEAEERIDTEENTYKAVQEMVKCGWDRKSWLVFASGIDHAEHIAVMLQMHGINAATSHSKLSKEINDQRIADFKTGKIQCLVNNNKLTTGFDHPGIDLIGMLRATQSTGLWVQMLGRGTRPCEGKDNCLVLDFVGNTERLGPINDPLIPGKPGKKKDKGEAPIKICDNCGMYCHTSVRVCPCCNTEFPIKEKVKEEASTLELIRLPGKEYEFDLELPVITEYPVIHRTYQKHTSNKSTLPSFKVTYWCGVDHFNEWLFFDHTGFPKRKANAWWLRNSKNTVVPATVEEALSLKDFLKTPKTIKVSTTKNKKSYPEIVGYTFEE